MPVELREPYGQLLEPLTSLSYIAARTEKLKVGTSLLILPQRNPILVAKQAATLDAFSGGRLVLGTGAGWAEKEYGFLNADFRGRSKVYDESIRLMRALWSEDVVDFEGNFFHVKDAVFLPKPVNRRIPVWIGGNSGAAVRRAIRCGDGWHPVGLTAEAFAEGAEKILKVRKDVVLSIRMTTDVRKRRGVVSTPGGEKRVAVSGSPVEVRRGIDEYANAGLEYYCASINHPAAEDIVADVRRFAADVVRSYG
jgi:probable F420-dependent oxidoreductase